MGGLSLPTLHPAVPATLVAADAQQLHLRALRDRVEHRWPVHIGRSASAAQALGRTLQRMTRVRGPLAEEFASVAVVIDSSGWYGDHSYFGEDSATVALYPRGGVSWNFIGTAIDRLEAHTPGLGETVLAALDVAEFGLAGIATPKRVREWFAMLYWDYAAADEEARIILTDERGYSDDDRPLLPSEFDTAAGGTMWLAPKRRLGARAVRAALTRYPRPLASELAALVTTHLPQIGREARKRVETAEVDMSWHGVALCIWPHAATANGPRRLLDDVEQDRANSGEDDVLLRCELIGKREHHRSRGRVEPAHRRPVDGLALVGSQLRGYHLVNRLLHLLQAIDNHPL